MPKYEVEFKASGFQSIQVEAANLDEAVGKAWVEFKAAEVVAEWDIETVENLDDDDDVQYADDRVCEICSNRFRAEDDSIRTRYSQDGDEEITACDTCWSLMLQEEPGQKCPNCGAVEVESNTPRTTYACGSSDYDQRPGTFVQKCTREG